MERPSILDNPHADRVKKVASLAGRSMRSRTGMILVEGPQAVRELLLHRPDTVRDVYLTEAATRTYPDVAALAQTATRWVHTVTPDVASAMSGDAQGIVAVAKNEAIICELSEVRATPAATQTFMILAQGRDPGNVGTIVRTADAMGASAVFLCAGTVDVTNPKVIRSSAGSVFHLPLVRASSFEEAVLAVHARGGEVLGTSGIHGALDLSEMLRESILGVATPLTGTHAWAMGNEAKGLGESELEACDHLVFIPMSGDAESLNVASAATICLYASQTAQSIQL